MCSPPRRNSPARWWDDESPTDYIRILPELVLTVFGMLVMLIDPLLPEHNDRKGAGHSGAHRFACSPSPPRSTRSGYPGPALFGMVQVDSFSVFFHLIVGFVVAAVILASFEYLAVQRIRLGEYYGLILLGAVGMMLMSSAVELVLIFIALEISSISTYILAGFRRHVRHQRRSRRSSISCWDRLRPHFSSTASR